MQTIAISTFNRKPELQSCLACLAEARGLDGWAIRIHDDASDDYDIGDIVASSGLAAFVSRNRENLGCDANNVDLLRTCLDAGAQRIFVLDSDLIVASDVLEFIDRNFDRTDGVLSVYNSVLHPVEAIFDGDLLIKNSVGGAATVWDAGLLRSALDRLDGPDCWDWRICDTIAEMKLRIFVASNSRAQHIGISGTNNMRFGELEYGIGFMPENPRHTAALARTLDILLTSQPTYLQGAARLIKKPRLARWADSVAKRLPKSRR